MILDGRKLANYIADKLKYDVAHLKYNNINPKLIVFTSSDPASQVYVRNKIKRAEEIGIEVETIKANIAKDVLDVLEATDCPFIIQKPSNLFDGTEDIILNTFKSRDADGFSSSNLGDLLKDGVGTMPCTPMGTIELLQHYEIPIEGRDVTIIGRSDIVGKPLAMMLTNYDANVTLCHSQTPFDKLIKHCKNADIVIFAVGKYNYLEGWKANNRQVVVDVGINHVDNELHGDFAKEAYENAFAYTPVPGGIGPMTVIELMRNVVAYYFNAI